jgi:peroxiredoxin
LRPKQESPDSVLRVDIPPLFAKIISSNIRQKESSMTTPATGVQIKIGNLSIGDMIPPFELPATSGENFIAGTLGGKFAVLIFYPIETFPLATKLLENFRNAFPQFKTRGTVVLGIALTPTDQQKLFTDEHQLPFPLLSDSQLQTSAAFGVLEPKTQTQGNRIELNAAVRIFLITPDMRITKIYQPRDPSGLPETILADVDALREPPRRMVSHAPVLLIPNVLPIELCERLIQIWHDQGSVDSGFMRQIDGQTVGMTDYSHKIRRDHFMQPCPELDQIKKYMSSRVIPQIRAAYNYEVSRFEDFRIACYDSSRGGYFRPHRDNTTDGTAHRRFAMSLLLNNDYEGGTLRFPEFAQHEYRPNAGAAVIFSCSLLHEATDITAGKRFVLLSFFYGEKEAKIREEYNRRTGGAYKA